MVKREGNLLLFACDMGVHLVIMGVQEEQIIRIWEAQPKDKRLTSPIQRPKSFIFHDAPTCILLTITLLSVGTIM